MGLWYSDYSPGNEWRQSSPAELPGSTDLEHIEAILLAAVGAIAGL